MMKPKLVNEINSMIIDNMPSFFKIIFPGHSNENLRIPHQFMKYMSKERTDNAILRVTSGCHWHIKLHQTVDGVYLQNGWQEFFNDNSLGDNEFLTFTYDGKMCFNVKIFKKNGVERVGVSGSTTHEQSATTGIKRKRGRPRKRRVGAPRSQELKSCQNNPDQHLQCCKSNIRECFNLKDVKKKIETKENSDTVISSVETELCSQDLNSLATCDFSRGVPSTKKGKGRIRETVENFVSEFPYFKSCLKPDSVDKEFVMPIPKSFSVKYLPASKSKMVLRNPMKKRWMVYTIPGVAGDCYTFCGGWNSFARDNMLKQGDWCVFELVLKDEMLVHIFRSPHQV